MHYTKIRKLLFVHYIIRYIFVFINTKHHIAAEQSQAVLLKKIARLESLAGAQVNQINLQKQEIKALKKEVGAYKWGHILAKAQLTRTNHKLQKAQKEIGDLEEALRVARLPKNRIFVCLEGFLPKYNAIPIGEIYRFGYDHHFPIKMKRTVAN